MRVESNVKAGGGYNQTVKGLRVKTNIKAGLENLIPPPGPYNPSRHLTNHNQTVTR